MIWIFCYLSVGVLVLMYAEFVLHIPFPRWPVALAVIALWPMLFLLAAGRLINTGEDDDDDA